MNLISDNTAYLSELLTLLSGVILLFAIFRTGRALKQLRPGNRSYKASRNINVLLAFFVLGCLVSFFIIRSGNEKAYFIVSGITILIGAASGYLAVFINSALITDLAKHDADLEAVSNDRQKLEKKVSVNHSTLTKYNNALTHLTKNIFKEPTINSSIYMLTEKSAEVLDLERVSIWRYNERDQTIECVELFEKSKGTHSEGLILNVKDYAAYFTALEDENVIGASDASLDPRTFEFSLPYLTPLNISSTLDAMVRVEGEFTGIICNEHIGPKRTWTIEDRSFASSLAAIVAAVVEAYRLKKTEKQLELSLSLMKATIESTADGILVVDNEGKITEFNKQFAKMWGVPADILGTKDRDKVVAFFLEQVIDPEGFLSRAQGYRGSLEESFDTIEFKDGRTFERFSKPQMDQDKVVGRVWSFRDITQRRRGEEEIHKLNAELETRVQQRTQEVNSLNEELKRNISELERANKELESFSYTVSHDLRAPIRGISNFAGMFEKKYKDTIDPEGKKYLESIERNSKKISTLISGLLDFSRLGKKEIKKESLDINELVTSMIKEIDISQWNPNTRITVKDLLPVTGDKILLYQVFFNLVANGLKYSRNKENPLIEIGSYSQGHENVYYVKDNGAGFDMAYSDKLFKTFQRLHGSEEFEGTGIGLAIIYGIITRHGGRVWAEGKVNEGATFYFALPNENPRVVSSQVPKS